MDTPSPQLSCTRRYSQRPKTHFSEDARQLLYNFTASRTQCELGEVQDRPSRPPSSNNGTASIDFSRSTSSPTAELSSAGNLGTTFIQ